METGKIIPYCRDCGKKLKENAKFCSGCGKPTSVKAVDKDKDYVTGLFGEKYKKYNKMTTEEKRNSNWKNFLYMVVAVGLFIFLGPTPSWLLAGYGILLFVGFLYCMMAGRGQPSEEGKTNEAPLEEDEL